MTNITYALGILTAVFFLSTHSFAKTSSLQNLSAALNSTIEKALQEKRIVGTVVLVAKDGKIIFESATGYADRETKKTMTSDTVFRLASMSKPIVSLATLVLLDQGKLKLDDPITKWIPSFKPKLKKGDSPTITVRHLLTHTAGLTYGFLEAADGPYHKLKVSDGLDDVGISLQENLKRLSQAPLLFPPGSAWQYSLATDVLGEVVAKAGGASLPQVIQKTVTGPLKMKNTTFFAASPEQLAVPYADGKPEPVRMSDHYSLPFGSSAVIFSPGRALNKNAYPSGGGGMLGNAKDYLKFLETVRNNGEPLLKAVTNRLFITNQIGNMSTFIGAGWGWTLGAAIVKDSQAANTPQKSGTIAWGGVYGHSWWIDPQEKLTVIILTNTAIEGMSGAFPSEVRDTIYSRLPLK